MELSRRKLLALGASSVALLSLGTSAALASKADEAIAKFTGGADAGEGALELIAPEIAENGNTVPIGL